MDKTLANNKVEFHDNILTCFGKTFFYFESFSSLKIDDLEKYDAIIIDARDVEFTRIIIKKFRSHSNMEFYLKPLFLINNKVTDDPYIKELADGIIMSFDQIPETINDINQIYMKITRLESSPSSSFEIQVFKKALNFMFTREINTLKPITDINSTIGYCYPLISVNFEAFEEAKVIEILEWAEKEHLIWPDFQDRVYLCSNCKGGHLSFREICPNCDSANMRSEDLVHHFPCGYIGAISDFKNNIDTVLTCPKCSKNLRHIGVDYDKPSIINHCQNCNDVFQDYLVKAKCIQCKTDTDVQFLISKDINLYKLTKKGRNSAVGGIYTSDYELNHEIVGTLDFKTFSTMMHYEQERTKANVTLSSNLVVFYFENIFDLYKIVSKSKEKSLLTEFVTIIRDNITPADFICINNPSIISICINDVAFENASLMVLKITDMIEELVRDNFEKFEILVVSQVALLSKSQSFDKQIQSIIKELVEKT
ncbi:MAG: hypothetical protein H7141_10455 [Burkholderiales bacterium]|nr:hypothetical protein [Bacteroidia bacterium]